MEFVLPPVVRQLAIVRANLRAHYAASGLKFTLDGNLVGDLGEALAAELFGVVLGVVRNVPGIDGLAPDGRTVQVKATGTARGPAFRQGETRADHLLFFALDFDAATGRVVFNGPERIALKLLPKRWSGQRSLSAGQIARADREVAPGDRLTLVSQP